MKLHALLVTLALVALSSDAANLTFSTLHPTDGDGGRALEQKRTESAAVLTTNVTRATYNATPPALTDGTAAPLQLDSGGQLKVLVGNGTATDCNVTNQTYVTNIVITNYTGTDLVAGDVAAPGTGVPLAVRRLTGSGTLLSITYITPTTNGLYLDLLICQQPITWPANSAAAALQSADLTNCLGVVTFTNSDFHLFGTTYTIATKSGINIPIRSTTNSIFIYPVARAAVTNAGNDNVIVGIWQD